MPHNLDRFIIAHHQDFRTALAEIRAGRKRSHWMWYIFPQISGLGYSTTARFYALKSLGEAAAFLAHPVLGHNLMTIAAALLKLDNTNATAVFGTPDDMKLRSSMTLFSILPSASPVFKQVLDRFFAGRPDDQTIRILGAE